MAKLILSSKVKLDITEDGKVVKTFNVTFRELSRKQQKAIGKDNKEILDIFQKGQSTTKRVEVLEAKLAALGEVEDPKATLSTANKLETIYDEQDKLEEKFEKLGGIEKLLEASTISYDMLVGGKDKAILKEFAESESDYSVVLAALRDDLKEQKGNAK